MNPMPRVLIVDDSQIDRTLAAQLLRGKSEHEVIEVAGGAEALEILERDGCAVIVTDMQMPGMNGLELLDAATRIRPDIPIVLMTAQGSEELAVTALERGAASYVTKRRLAADLAPTVDRVWRLSFDRDAAAELSACLTSVEAGYRLDNDLQRLLLAAEALPRGIERFWDCPPTTRVQLSVALEEALTNSYYYGNLEMDPALKRTQPQEFLAIAAERAHAEPYSSRTIELTARFSAEGVEFTIRDQGRGFDVPAALSAADPLRLSEGSSGRGLRLMQTFMDEVRFNEQGNSVTLIRRRGES
jgi:CheY-like chemotaxis protein